MPPYERWLIVTGGLPGSGKTTFVERNFCDLPNTGWADYVHRPDDHLMLNGLYAWTPDRAAEVWRNAYRVLGHWLTNGLVPTQDGTEFYPERFILDSTMVSSVKREIVVNLAKGVGVKVHGVWFDIPLQTCLARNATRTPDRKVPEKEIARMLTQLSIPTKDEGFDMLTIITPENADWKVVC